MEDDPQLHRLIKRRRLLAQLTAVAIAGGIVRSLSAVDRLIPRFRVTRSGTMNCLPRHDYQYRPRSPSVIAQSMTVQRIDSLGHDVRIANAQDPNAPVTPEEALLRKRFRPSNRVQLRIDHCRVSDIVLDIENTGAWTMSLLAEQNPPLEPEEDLRFRQRLHLRRNAFQIEARLFTGTASTFTDVVETDVQDREPNPGRLIIARIRPREFWVQREEPRSMHWQGYSTDIAAGFALVNSAEFEFFYRHDPLSGAGENVRRLEGP